ncbi:MAG TPA: oligopeptide:H+ symporter [Streptosporangiales bacterium]
MADTEQTGPQRRFFGHPRGLANLFGIEIWESFSFYGMQAILTYYLYFSVTKGGLGLPQASATSLVGAYGGLVYLATVLGAWVADRVLGSERTLFYSGVLILAGHACLAAIPGLTGVGAGLACVGVGSGALKANTTSLLGSLYAEGDPRRDAGFSIFYMGINIGALAGPLLTGLVHSTLGFHYGFGLAAVGMAIGLAQYAMGRRNLGGAGRHAPRPLARGSAPRVVIVMVLGAAVIVAAFATGLVTLANLAVVVTGLIAVASVVLFVVILAGRQINDVERSRVWAFVPLFVASFGFFALFQQIFTVIAIYAQQRVDLDVAGFAIPPAWAQSVDPVGILLFAPVFAALWTRLGDRQPSTPTKFVLGLFGIGVCFLLFLPMAGGTGRTSPALAVAGILLLFSFAELMLSPIGLSVSTKLAPAAFRTQMVGLNYLSVAAGTAAAGALAGLYTPHDEFGYFGLTGGAAVVLAVLLAALGPWVRRMMRGVR